MRCVGDFTRSSVNLAVSLTESPKPRTVDVLGALCIRPLTSRMHFVSVVQRQSPRHTHTSWFQGSQLEQSEGLQNVGSPVWDVKSVHAFLRIAHSLWFLIVHCFSILWIDDFVVRGLLSMGCSSSLDGLSQKKERRLRISLPVQMPWVRQLMCRSCTLGQSKLITPPGGKKI